ncbi:MAG: hypothetical protein NPIRA02_17570 [Nitrospirales bacterium]|nr:MAG: hypothetical protein NPIRA02_17570 [Nitrospirales bacterium]
MIRHTTTLCRVITMLLIFTFVSLNLFLAAVEVFAEQESRDLSSQHVTPSNMVLIPAGVFEMGSPNAKGSADEYPQHSVSLDAFFLDTYEVTNRQFRKFVKLHRYKTTAEKQGKAWAYVEGNRWTEVPGAWWRKPEGQDSVFASRRGSHPVVTVSWLDAKQYCESVGKRLPTEAEWEYAARAGSTKNVWWGTPQSASHGVGNVADTTHKHEFPDRPWPILESYDDQYVRTAPVGKFPPNAWGLYDMIGNAWEWVSDWYAEGYYAQSSERNPQGPSSGHFKVLRGGSWSTSPEFLGTGVRIFNHPTSRNAAHGIRCAKDAERQ